MPELVTPKQMRKELAAAEDAALLEVDADMQRAYLRITRICRDYLTLWERNKELEAALAAANSDLVGRWVCSCGVSIRDGDSHSCHETAKIRKHLSGTNRTFLDYP